jgi:hypothetical protein
MQRLFQVLRDEAGLKLGVDQYLDFVHALQAGYGLEDLAGLKRLCMRLWAHSREEVSKVEYHFERMMAAEMDRANAADGKAEEGKKLNEKEGDSKEGDSAPIRKPPVNEGGLKPEAPAQTGDAAASPSVVAAGKQQLPLGMARKQYSLRLRYTRLPQSCPCLAQVAFPCAHGSQD